MFPNKDEFEIDEIKNGYRFDMDASKYICLHCGMEFQIGEIYKMEDRFFDAPHAVNLHIKQEHNDRFDCLLNSNNKYISLTDNQKDVLRMIFSELTDNEIAAKLGVTPSTVRHQKFMFREKAKQAKYYLAIYELATGKKQGDREDIVPIHDNAKMVDERYVITKEENANILNNAFSSLEPLKLKFFSSKEKKKIVILRKISEQFKKNVEYTEEEVNQILQDIYSDYATLRRYLIEYGFMERKNDCSRYWLK